jgi:hypothetical protein
VLLLVALLPLGLLAFDAPPHPTLIMAEYRGKLVPVVAVEKETAIALVEGKRQKLSARAALQTNRVGDFSATRAKLLVGQIANLQVLTGSSGQDAERLVGTPGATIGGYIEFAATITAERDLKDCYIALVSFRRGFLENAAQKPDAQIRLRQIPDLAANRPTDIKFSTEPFLGDASQRAVVVLLFSGAEEVYTGPNALAWSYFLRREDALHRAATATWLERNRGKDLPLTPTLQVPPFFPSPVDLPAEVQADLTIDDTGSVTMVALPEGLAPATRETLERTLRAWRFYPKLVGGVPTPARVRVPLQF